MSGSVNICAVTDEVKKALKDFRFRKAQDTAALVLKVDREKQQIIIDEILEDITVEELRESLASHQPRYIVLSYRQEHKDGRISYPLCFIYFTPRDSHAELQMMYAGSKIALQQEAELTRAYEIRELEDLTEEWLLGKLGLTQVEFLMSVLDNYLRQNDTVNDIIAYLRHSSTSQETLSSHIKVVAATANEHILRFCNSIKCTTKY